MVKDADIYRLMLRLIRFPSSSVCVHFVAIELYDILEKAGCNPPDDLAKYLVNAEDDLAEKTIENLID